MVSRLVNDASSAQLISVTVARGDRVGVAGVLELVPLQFEDVHGCVCMHSMLVLIGDARCDMVLERERQKRRRKYAAQPEEVVRSGQVACGGQGKSWRVITINHLINQSPGQGAVGW